MRGTSLSIIFLLAAAGVAHAQAPAAEVTAAAQPADAAATPPPPVDDWDKEVSDFDKLRTPDSPAFVVLGVSPTEIQRPTTPGTLIAALGGALSNSSLPVPKDFALEVAPYWLYGHPGVGIEDYRRNHLMRPLRTLSLSVATTQTTRADDTSGAMTPHTDSQIGVGARTTLVQLGDEDKCTTLANQAGVTMSTGALLDASDKAQLDALGKPGDAAYDARRDELINARVKAREAAQKTYARLQNDKCVGLATAATGFQVTLAGAADLQIADTKLAMNTTTLAGYAVWANASYDWPSLSVVTMGRLASHDVDMTTERAFDAGARGIYKAKNFVVSAEALVRYRLGDVPDRTTMKVDGGLEYELTSDTWVSVTFGKDFAFRPGDAASLFSVANLKWGFMKSPTGR